MKKDREFYIGWQEEMPTTTRRFLKRLVIFHFIVAPLLVAGIVWHQQRFNDHRFELGQVKAITGIYYASPVPMLYADEDALPEGLSRSMLLVGFGKFGAESIMKDIEAKAGPLNGKRMTLSGTLIYGDGHTVMELTDKADAFVKLLTDEAAAPQQAQATGRLKETGEILDPKCYFGVMKPGEGKIHKSCAIRCLSGGIPPVFKTREGGEEQYYIVLGADGEKLNSQLLPYVGFEVLASGNTGKFLDWNLLYISEKSLPLQLTQREQLCASPADSLKL
jgi:hypothetical protein